MEGLDVDDLFGDPASLDLGLSPPKGLAQRLDEMRQLGCCRYVDSRHPPSISSSANRLARKLAWSRLGCIAWISSDGLRVSVRYLLCRPTDGSWVLSDDNLLLSIGDHGHHVLVHLSWNEAGSDLAIVDSSGRVSIYAVSIGLNNLVVQRQAILDPDDEGGQIVGMMWLNVKRPVRRPICEFALKRSWLIRPVSWCRYW
jgi:mediator of RNA polymerase II transcription subunit 16, fungi type